MLTNLYPDSRQYKTLQQYKYQINRLALAGVCIFSEKNQDFIFMVQNIIFVSNEPFFLSEL